MTGRFLTALLFLPVLPAFIAASQRPVLAAGVDISGSISAESRLFFEKADFPGQPDNFQGGLVFEPELAWDAASGNDQFSFKPFYRLDSNDSSRSHFDIREASWRHVSDDWEILFGVNQVFWGVTESRHLVNVINQVDGVENIDEEDVLGQPMVNLTLYGDWGEFALFYLPYFRERTFPGRDGRLRGPLVVDEDAPIFSGSLQEWRPAVAARYGQAFGPVDLGLSFYHGTGREPTLVPAADFKSLRPVYRIINQAGLDLQYTQGAFLWKLEAIAREGQGKTFFASVAGVEYTFYQVFETVGDLGLLFEYLHDGRSGIGAPATAFEDDLFFGARFAANDVQDFQLLAGAIIDAGDGTAAVFVEASRRLGQAFRIEIEGRFFLGANAPGNAFFPVRNDSFLTVKLGYFF